MIIDAHIHLPAGEAFQSFAAKKEAVIREMERNNVSKCLVIADSWPDSDIGSTNELVSLFPRKEDTKVFVVAGISPIVHYSDGLKELKNLLEQKSIVGIKLFTGHEEFYLTDERLMPVYEMAEMYSVPVLFHSGWEDVQYSDVDVTIAIAQRYPCVQFVCCHCWYPEIAKCKQLFDLTNVTFDLSSVADNPRIAEMISEDVKKLIETMQDRVIFGSDSFGCSMSQHISFIKNLMLEKTIEQKVFADNASRIYGI